jgi:type IV pilus assembly protein PilY1
MVGSPSQFFEDAGFSGTGGFYEKKKDRKKLIIVGANDGMLHAFDATTGIERWAFIPNSVLKNLKLMKTTKDHIYFVDSTPKVADVWLDYDGDNKKITDEWRTVLVCGLRKGGKTYFALDITDTLNPKYLWEFPNPSDPNYATTLEKLGQSWSEPAIGKVKVGGKERWVAFIGGGFRTTGDEGRVFYVVDMKTGLPIKEFSKLEGMDKSLAAPCTAVDTNADGFVEKVYIGDLKGHMWVFDVSNSDTTKWKGQIFFKASGDHPIYYRPAVAFDKNGILWVYFGTGDRENPNDKNSQERFYAVKDDGKGSDGKGSYPLEEKHLSDITDKNKFDPVSTLGWYIQLPKGEKVLAKPAVFNRLVYFTTYTYYKRSEDPCAVAGLSKEYVVEHLSGGGAFNVDDMSDILNPPKNFDFTRSQEIGTGAPSAPVITVNMKGKASVIIGTTSGQISSREGLRYNSREILYWREVVP